MDEQRYRTAERRLWASVGASPREQRLALDRLGVTVRVQEVGQGSPVLFVHGASNGGGAPRRAADGAARRRPGRARPR